MKTTVMSGELWSLTCDQVENMHRKVDGSPELNQTPGAELRTLWRMLSQEEYSQSMKHWCTQTSKSKETGGDMKGTGRWSEFQR